MQPVLVKHPEVDRQTISIRNERLPNFYNPWHYHPEMELVLVLESEGTRFVGDSIHKFEPGDLVILGPNVPHVWQNHAIYFKQDPHFRAQAIVVHFYQDFAGKDFLELPEATFLTSLWHIVQRGIRIQGASQQKVSEILHRMLSESPFQQILSLLQLLDVVYHSRDYVCLASQGFMESVYQSKDDRFNRVYDYIMHHFSQPIRLEDVAFRANLSPTAFCRYSKKKTRKSFSQLLKELRISYACRLLIEDNLSIAQVAYHSGYNNLSNFNAHFKSIQQRTPKQYRSQFIKY